MAKAYHVNNRLQSRDRLHLGKSAGAIIGFCAATDADTATATDTDTVKFSRQKIIPPSLLSAVLSDVSEE